MHVPHSERIEQWRASARADREAADALYERWPHLACYHAQQAGEKALKALITALQGDSVPTHLGRVLIRALSELGNSPPKPIAGAVLALDAYYIPTRYPDALDFADAALTYGLQEARHAIETADDVLAWIDAEIAKLTFEE